MEKPEQRWSECKKKKNSLRRTTLNKYFLSVEFFFRVKEGRR